MKTLFQTLLFVTLSSGLLISPALAASPSPQKLAEQMLLHFNKGEFSQAFQMMSPRTKKLLKLSFFRNQMSAVMKIIGDYIPGTLKLKKKKSSPSLKKTRFTFHARFQQDQGKVYMVLDSNNKISAFMIHSPKLAQRVKKNIFSVAQPKKKLLARLNTQIDLMLKGYNQKKWKTSCQTNLLLSPYPAPFPPSLV